MQSKNIIEGNIKKPYHFTFNKENSPDRNKLRDPLPKVEKKLPKVKKIKPIGLPKPTKTPQQKSETLLRKISSFLTLKKGVKPRQDKLEEYELQEE